MFRILDGREKFYQWDLHRQLIVNDNTISQVHFANCLCPAAHVCEAYEEEGLWVVDVPNELLTEYMDIRVWGYDGTYTKHCATFEVVKRTKPEDYIYTEPELKTWEKHSKQIEALAVHNYLTLPEGGEIDVSGIMLEMPVRLQSHSHNIDSKVVEGNFDSCKEIIAFPETIKLHISTDYQDKEYLFTFPEPFYTGYVYWTEGYYAPTRRYKELDVSKLKLTDNGTTVYTTVEEQGWENFSIANRSNTLSNNLFYSTSNTVNQKFNIANNGMIIIDIYSFTNQDEDTILEQYKELLEGTYFVYPVSQKRIYFDNSFPEIIGKTEDDDFYLSVQYLDMNDDRIRPMYHTFEFKQVPQNYIVEEIQKVWDYLSEEIEPRLDSIEENL